MNQYHRRFNRALKSFVVRERDAREYGNLHEVYALIEVAEDPGYVRVKMPSGTYDQAWNRGSGSVALRAGLAVKMIRRHDRKLIMDGEDDRLMQGDENAPSFPSGVPPHPFTEHIDVPSDYIGQAGKVFKVSPTEDGVIFETEAPGAVDSVNGQVGVVLLDSDDIAEGATNLYFTAAEETKLAGIAAGAEVNVNADWTSVAGDSLILNKPTIPSQYTDEMARDALGTALVGGTGVTVTPNDGADTITIATTITQYTDEMAQDAVGGMFTGNVETDIAATYQDATAKIDLVVSPTLVGDRIHAATGKTTPVDADELGLADSAASFVLKKLTWANLKATFIATAHVWSALQRFAATVSIGSIAPVGGARLEISAEATSDTPGDNLLLRFEHIGSQAQAFGFRQNVATNLCLDRLSGGVWTQVWEIQRSTGNVTFAAALSSATTDAHIVATAAHGATGAVVGTTNTQTLTNKTLTAPVVADFTNAAHDHGDADDGGGILATAVPATFVGDRINAAANKATPVAADRWPIWDSVDSLLKYLTTTQLVTWLSTLFAVLAGTAGGQSLSGGNAANDDLTLQGTTHATRTTSYVKLQPNGGNTGIGAVSAPGAIADVGGAIRSIGTGTAPAATGVGQAVELWYWTGAGGPYALLLAFDRDASTYKPMRISGSEIGFEEGAARIMTIDGGNVGVLVAVPLTPLQVHVGTNQNLGVVSSSGELLLTAFEDTGATNVPMRFAATQFNFRGASLRTQPGTSTDDAAVGGVLYVTTTQAGNLLAGKDVLATYTLPANTLAVNGQSIWIEVCGEMVNNSNFKEFYIEFGAAGVNTVIATTGHTTGATDFVARGRVIRTGAATQVSYGSFARSLASPVSAASAALDQTLSSAVVINISAVGVATNDVIIYSVMIGWSDNNV